MSFQSLIDVFGADKFIDIEKKAKQYLSTADGWMESESTILGFLDLMLGEEMDIALIQQPDVVTTDRNGMISWFDRHQDDLRKRLWFLCEIFQQHRAVLASSSDIESESGTAQNSETS
jgi:hypothetical protein